MVICTRNKGIISFLVAAILKDGVSTSTLEAAFGLKSSEEHLSEELTSTAYLFGKEQGNFFVCGRSGEDRQNISVTGVNTNCREEVL